MSVERETMGFWDHFDVLRGYIIRFAAVVMVISVGAFCCKDALFAFVFAPKSPDFVTYRLLHCLTHDASLFGFHVELINTGLAEQFIIHMKMACYAGLLCASPYAVLLLFRFVAPALYGNERRYFRVVLSGGYVMFLVGAAISYFVIFPLTFRFLGTYQVATDVQNLISLQSYVGTLVMLCMVMGVTFEIPIVCWLMAKLGFITADVMKRFRRHAIVAILILAAVITPTGDVFTLSLVAIPIYALYEASVLIVRHTAKG